MIHCCHPVVVCAHAYAPEVAIFVLFFSKNDFEFQLFSYTEVISYIYMFGVCVHARTSDEQEYNRSIPYSPC